MSGEFPCRVSAYGNELNAVLVLGTVFLPLFHSACVARSEPFGWPAEPHGMTAARIGLAQAKLGNPFRVPFLPLIAAQQIPVARPLHTR